MADTSAPFDFALLYERLRPKHSYYGYALRLRSGQAQGKSVSTSD
jgi:hypothetical protein